jgi:hypothetical protein
LKCLDPTRGIALKGRGFSRAVSEFKNEAGLYSLRKNSKRREAGVSTPHKANNISGGFSPGGTLFITFAENCEFFRSLFSPRKLILDDPLFLFCVQAEANRTEAKKTCI